MSARYLSIVLAASLCGLSISCTNSDPTPTPSITGFSPSVGPASTSVTISGLNFGFLPEHNEVRFNGIKAVVIASTPTTITVTVPEAASSGVITVTVNGQSCISATHFTVNPLMGRWRFTGAAATNCTDPLEEGVVACTFDCPILDFKSSTVIFSNSAASYTFNYTIAVTTVTISSPGGSFAPGFVISGDRLTLVYPPGDCSVTETYVKI